MRRYSSRIFVLFLITIVLCLLLLLLLFYFRKTSPTIVFLPFPTNRSTSRTHDFRSFPRSRSFEEFSQLQIDERISTIFSSFDSNCEENDKLSFSETKFRSADFPIIWLDGHGDVRWNRPAQSEFLHDLLEKQFPSIEISDCLSRPLFVVDQWSMGFFSRYHCFIEQFGQTMYSSRMTFLAPKRFHVSGSDQEDFLGEGILRYFHSISFCSQHLKNSQLKILHEQIRTMPYGSSNVETVNDVHQLLDSNSNSKTFKVKFSREIWKFGYEHIPHRRWLFDRKRNQIRQRIHYDSPISSFIDHSNEHIYIDQDGKLDLKIWSPRNAPQGPPKNVLAGTNTSLTVNDQIFTSFLRYMFVLFFSPLAPRIQLSAKLLAQHWTEYFADKLKKPSSEALKNMAAIFIRRGDKMPEDSFWQKHRRWRNVSMYVKGLVDEEKRRQTRFSLVFVMTDDLSVMNSIQEYARDGLSRINRDESYARQHLHHREILYNVFAPQACFNPFVRIGFDQFLVNVQFVTDFASLIVGHTDSNVGRYLEELVYVQRQHDTQVQSTTYVINAPDSLD